MGSLLDIITFGTSCSLTISLIYSSANDSSEVFTRMAKKWVDLINLSIITHMASCFFRVWGKPMIKSVIISSHFHSSISYGDNNPCGL